MTSEACLVTESPDMWTIDIIYMGSCHNRPRGGVVEWTVRPYSDIWHIHSCIWMYVDIVTTGPIHIFTNGFMVSDAGPLLLFREERCIKVTSTNDSWLYIVLPSITLTSGASTIPSRGEVWQLLTAQPAHTCKNMKWAYHPFTIIFHKIITLYSYYVLIIDDEISTIFISETFRNVISFCHEHTWKEIKSYFLVPGSTPRMWLQLTIYYEMIAEQN